MLTAISECLALLTLGLIRPWGEVVPRRIPWLGGRRIPIRAAVIPAAAGAIAVTALCACATLDHFFHFVPPLNKNGESFPTSGPGNRALVICCVPLLARGPLLAAVTVAHYRRRRADRGGELPRWSEALFDAMATRSPAPATGTGDRHRSAVSRSGPLPEATVRVRIQRQVSV
ncbi:hypothetical protein [Streptomyces sp. NPDC054854]